MLQINLSTQTKTNQFNIDTIFYHIIQKSTLFAK